MKVLILGGTGMLGHQLFRSMQGCFDVWTSIRGSEVPPALRKVLLSKNALTNVRADNFDSVVSALARLRPDVVINGIGIVKQLEQARDPIATLTVNSLFPHRLAQLCQAAGSRLIHISTDCVFSGRVGNYEETDTADAEDLYGRSKLMGEVQGPGCLTLRTSIIGHELNTRHGLLEWFLAQDGKSVKGYRRAIFSGLTTHALSACIIEILRRHPGLDGLFHLAADPISKYDLLQQIGDVYGTAAEIASDATVVCDRSLNGTRFREATGWRAPAWPEMIREMWEHQPRIPILQQQVA